MTETVFLEILGEAVMLDCEAINNVPEHKFSLKHKLAMKRIFSRFERNSNKLTHIEFESEPRLSLKQRVIITAILILLMAFLVGWMWISEGLFKIDLGSLKGYTVNENMLSKAKNQAPAPTHQITDEQIEQLQSKYDFESLSRCSIESEEYGKFILDLVEMNVFSTDDVENMFGVMRFNANHPAYLYALETDDGKTGYVNPFGGEDNYLGEDELQHGLIVEYLKSKYDGLSEEEYNKMAEELANQRRECLSVIDYIFDKTCAATDADSAVIIQNITIDNGF